MEAAFLTTAVVTEGTIELLRCTSLLIIWPAVHGAGAANTPSYRLSTHATLVSQPKTAHELLELPRKKAQSIGLNHITPNEKSPGPAQGLNHTLSLAPKGFFWLFSSLFAYKINQGET
ncbi:MAG: hypothetical protein NT166_14895 [Candidatus Aminicenantes bacterium]|nr:hypothetical protein [Candidatus Aminicenantes bacterium]